MRTRPVAGTLIAAALAAPTVAYGIGGSTPALAATACTPSTAQTTVTIDETALDLGDTIAFHGTGWCHPVDGGSRIGVKIDSGAVTRLDSSVHANRSLWAIVDADPATGDFAGSFDLPDGTSATSTPVLADGSHSLTFLTGSLKTQDATRSQTVAFTLGEAPSDGGGSAPKDVCTPTTATPWVRLGAATAALGGTLRVTGAGFCNPAGGGSTIAVKLDDGAYTRPDGSSIWATIQAEDGDGTFSADIALPDGTARASTPAFARGGHTLRLLTGSLAPGDASRTLESATFSIGAYAPAGVPDPLATSVLRPAARHGVKASLRAKDVVVRLPRTAVGTWVLASLYDQDGSPSYPWSTWIKVPASHRLVLARTPIARTGAEGEQRLVVQSGNEDHVGDLLGWARLRLPVATPTAPSTGSTTGSAAGGGAPTSSSAPPTTSTTTSTTTEDDVRPTPRRAFASYQDLDPRKHGSVRGRVAEGILTLTARTARPGQLVSVVVYTPDAILPAGWATLAADRSVSVDVSELHGYAGASLQTEDGTLLGWAPLSLGGSDDATTSDAAAEPIPVSTPAEGDTAPGLRPVAGSAVAGNDEWISGTDGLLLAGGALVLAVVSLLTARAPRRKDAAA